MKRSKIKMSMFLFSGILAIFPFSASALSMPERGSIPVPPAQEDSCLPILFEAAQRAGIPGVITSQYGNDGSFREDDIYCYLEISEERDGGIYYTELTINAYPPENSVCNTNGFDASFHEYAANTDRYSMEDERGVLELYTYGSWYLNWIVESGGTCHRFSVENTSEYPGWSEDVTMGSGTDFQMPDADPLPYAEVLWSVAEPYLPFSDGLTMNDGQSPPVNDGQDDSPGDFFNDSGATNSRNNKVPILVIVGSIGVPIIGAIAGTILSTILSGGGAAGSGIAGVAQGKKPKFGSTSEDGMVWSPRPWDQAGPGFVPKEEYERTKDFLEKGYEWDHGNWRTFNEIRQNDQLAQNNRDAVARKDAEWREKRESERQALEQNKAELKKKADDLQAAEDKLNMLEMEDDIEAIQQGLEDENIYVLNPYQGDPTLLFHGVNKAKNMVWDNTVGRWTGDQGLTCEGYVEKTAEKVATSVTKRFPGAQVKSMYFMENSSLKRTKNLTNFLDSINDDNHNLIKIILPDGSEWALDFHQYKAGKSPLLRPWSEARKVWKDYLGEKEFLEGPRHTYTTSPKPGL